MRVTFPVTYDDGNEVEFAPFDRFYLPETSILVTHWQLFEAHQTGRERLSFPAVQVTDLVGADGRRYGEGNQFVVDKGQVVWTGTDRPSFDPETNKGEVCSIRYRYRPYFYLAGLDHEIRATQDENFATGERFVVRLPQSGYFEREYVFLNEQRDRNVPDAAAARQQPGPASGGFSAK